MSSDDAVALVKELLEKPEGDYWESLGTEENSGNTLSSYRKLNVEGKPATYFQIKMVQKFPDVEVDQFFKMVSNMEARKEWDKERCNDMEKVGDAVDNKQMYYMAGKKPPIPLVQARDFLVNTWRDESSFGDGKKAFLWASVEDSQKGVKEGVTRMKIDVIATIVEKNTDGEGATTGCKVTEFRAQDMAGDMQPIAIEKGSKMGPKKYFAEWVQAIKSEQHKK